MALTNRLAASGSQLANIALGAPARNTSVSAVTPADPTTAGQALTMTAAHPSTGEALVLSGGQVLVLAVNADASDHLLSITSSLDDLNRKGDINDTISANSVRIFGPFPAFAWAQPFRSQLWLWSESALVSFGVVKVA